MWECLQLIVVVNDKHLLGIQGDSNFEDITNMRLIILKVDTLPHRFKIFHVPSVTNNEADAICRSHGYCNVTG